MIDEAPVSLSAHVPDASKQIQLILCSSTAACPCLTRNNLPFTVIHSVKIRFVSRHAGGHYITSQFTNCNFRSRIVSIYREEKQLLANHITHSY